LLARALAAGRSGRAHVSSSFFSCPGAGR
jgi:hypothetical protein